MRLAQLGVITATLLVLACGQSDDVVTGSVKTRLAENAALKVSKVEVATVGGVVTLSGTVASQADKEQAVHIARGATGVTNVVDNLKVKDAPATQAPAEPAAAGSAPATGSESSGTAHGVGAAIGGALKTAEEATVEAGKATGQAAAKGGKAVGSAAKSFGTGVKEGVTGKK